MDKETNVQSFPIRIKVCIKLYTIDYFVLGEIIFLKTQKVLSQHFRNTDFFYEQVNSMYICHYL